MLWHLCNPMGVSVRTREASCVQEAQFRLAPIPKGWFVASDASYRTGWVAAPERLPVKKTTGAKAKSDTRHNRWAERNPERVAAARAEWNRVRRTRRWNPERNPNQARILTGEQRQAIREANIRRGFARRKAKRESATQLTLGV